MKTGSHSETPLTTDDRLESIRAMLADPIEQTAPNNQAQGWRGDCAYLLTKADDLAADLAKAIPLLRTLARHCEDCHGYGAIVRGSSDEEAYEEPCVACKPLNDFIERIDPPRAPSASDISAAVEEEDDILF